ncbi:MAG: queuosine precursor transporter [Alphaproteobacteria bacterium]
MDAIDAGQWVAALNALPPELIWVAELLVCFGGILLFLRLFGPTGLCVFMLLTVIGANIEVLKVVDFSILPDPVAQGTILFASSYLCTDILNEYYGRHWAHRAVWLGFFGLLAFVVLMLLGLGFTPLTPEVAAATGNDWALGMQEHLLAVFTPAPIFFVAGMAAYLVSQFHDVWLYRLIRRLTGGRFLFLRNNVSTIISALIDTIVFSVLAWIVLPREALPLDTVIWTYIVGTWVLRVAVAMLDTPFIYLARRCLPPADRVPVSAERI